MQEVYFELRLLSAYFGLCGFFLAPDAPEIENRQRNHRAQSRAARALTIKTAAPRLQFDFWQSLATDRAHLRLARFQCRLRAHDVGPQQSTRQ